MKYEVKKLFSDKLLIVLMVVLLGVNCVLAYRAAPHDKEWQKASDAFYKDYNRNPSLYDARYEEYLTARDLAISNQIEAVMRGEDPEAYAFEEPRTIALAPGIPILNFLPPYTAARNTQNAIGKSLHRSSRIPKTISLLSRIRIWFLICMI